MRSVALPALLALALLPGRAGAQTAPPAEVQEAQPPPVTAEEVRAEAAGYTVGRIYLFNEDIFDPHKEGEDLWVFQLANRLHRTTRPEVIERQLLFKSGDRFSIQALRESERLLRASRYLYDARIRPLRIAEGKVDVEVVTRDVWTLQGGIAFHHAGGVSRTRFDLTDGNFLGTGKNLDVERTATVDRTSNLLRYQDPSVLGSRAQAQLWFAQNSDGSYRRLDFGRPFFALDTRWAAGVQGIGDDRVDTLYKLGKIADRFRHREDFAELYTGLSPGLTDEGTQRFRVGFTYDRNRFGAAAGTPAPSLLPGNRTLAYPWIGYEYVENGFVVERDFERLHRTEDLNLGRQLSLRLGLSAPAFGGDRQRWIFSGGAAAGWRPGPRQLLLTTLSASTRYRDGIENGILSGRLRYYVRDLGNNLFLVNVEGDLAERLDPETQIFLGGDSGVRGYPFRFQDGTRRWAVNLEQRFFGHREYLHLLHLGAAVFFDAGRAWTPGGPSLFDRGVLSDVGAGLRLGSSRSAQGTVVHLDLAVPLTGDRAIKRVQWLVMTSETF
ncbi:MAG TPA: hypothetical protein VOA87_11465 [Thermoanaerobaculia bacterium]|nr:hypothetical protein [Thermoanaerobaculia bacterium]